MGKASFPITQPRRRFRRGGPITSTLDAVTEILAGRYVFERHKPQHPGWMGSQQLHTISGSALRGHLYYAIDTQEKQSDED